MAGPNDRCPSTQPHYADCGIEHDDYMRANLSREELSGAYRYNVEKHLARYRRKNGPQDLLTARVYLDWLIGVESDNG